VQVATFAAIVAVLLIARIDAGQPADRVASCASRVRLQVEARNDPTSPFTLDLQGGEGTRLVYFGIAAHTFDPNHPQYAAMEKAWRELRPTEAYFEGTGNFVGDTLAASLAQSGEPGLVRFLARQDGIPVRSLEPTQDEEVAALLPTFTAEQVTLFYATRTVANTRDRRHLDRAALQPVIDQALASVRRSRQLAAVFPDVDAYRAAYRRWFPGLEPETAPNDWFDPIHTSAETGSRFFNDVNRATSYLRDQHMYELLARAWRPGARIFAEVGRDHIPAQAPALMCATAPYTVQ
jgi:hypothetical protein